MRLFHSKPWFNPILPIIASMMMLMWLALQAEGRLLNKHQSLVSGALVVREPRVSIIKSRRMLYLFEGARCVRTYPVDLGTLSVGQKRCKSDTRTPEGVFRVSAINEFSPYKRFIGISYPDPTAAVRGFSDGLVSRGDAQGILTATERGFSPDGLTALGGGIGIHGGRKGEDWTAGCVAVSDDAIEELYRVLRIGDVVEILP